MEQTKLESFIESCFNVGSGFIIALIVWMYFLPVEWMQPDNLSQSIKVTLTFTIVSILRGFFWRRLFNAQVHKKVHTFVSYIFQHRSV